MKKPKTISPRMVRSMTRRHNGYTIAELMLAIALFAFCSTAISSLMYATYNTNRAVNSTATTVSQAESVLRRMIELTRSAADISYSAGNGLMIQTPADSSNFTYIYTYYLKNDAQHAGQQQVWELIQKSNNNLAPSPINTVQDIQVIDNINTFTAARVGATFPEIWQYTLILNGLPNVSRTCQVTARNLTQ